MGAWIETYAGSLGSQSGLSHPLWVRGLKHNSEGGGDGDQASHPLWVRGLKLGAGVGLATGIGRILYGCVD